MVRVTYEFDLYDDREDLELYQKARDLYGALSDIDEIVRYRQKNEELSEKEYQFLEQVRELSSIVWDFA